MVDKRQPVADSAAQQLAHDNEDQHQYDQAIISDEVHDDVATNAARRRASLDKEIRAGWQRALGH